jgi:tetratricopeptide (TPR) repeat protein
MLLWFGLLLSSQGGLEGWRTEYSGGDWQASLDQALLALGEDSTAAESWAALAFSEAVLDSIPAARSHAMTALALDSTSAMAWGAFGRVLLPEDIESAVEAFSRSLELDSGFVLSSVGLAHAYVVQGNSVDASAVLEEALHRDSGWISLWMESIQTLMFEQESDKALQLADSALGLWPDSPLLLIEKGWILESLCKYESAAEAYETAALLDPEDTEALIALGLMYESLCDYGKAMKAYRGAEDRDPAYAWLQGEMALCLESAGNPEGAMAFYIRGIELDPAYAFAMYRLGCLYEDLGNPDEAILWFSRCVESDPTFVDAWISIGLHHEDQGNLAEAEEAYRDALEQDPANSWTWGELGAVLEQMGRTGEAAEAYEQGVTIFPDYIWAWEQRGILYEDEGDLEAAAAWYLQATQRTEPSSWLLGELAYVLEQQEHPDSAMVFYYKAITMDSTYIFGLMRLAPLEAGAGRIDAALTLWERFRQAGGDEYVAMGETVLLLEGLGRQAEADSVDALLLSSYPSAWIDIAYRYFFTDPTTAAELADRAEASGFSGDPLLWTDLAVLYGGLGREEGAEACFDTAISLSPDDADVWMRWGDFLFENDRDDEAAEKYREAVRLDSLSFDGWSRLGESLLFAKRYEEARAALGTALELDPGSQWVLAYMGLVYEQTGDPGTALDYYFQSLSVSPGYDYTETRIREITDTGFDMEWNRKSARMLNISMWADTRAENGNLREREYTVGGTFSYQYDPAGSLVSLETDYSLLETTEDYESDYTWSSATLSLERKFSEFFSMEVSSDWDRQPGTVRPWQISSYFSLGFNRWITDWLWVSPTLGVGLVDTHWSSGIASRRTDIMSLYGSLALWLEAKETLLPELWLWGDFYSPPEDPDGLITNSLVELTFEVWDPLSLTLGYSVAYTRRPLFSYWEKYDTEVYSRLNVRLS